MSRQTFGKAERLSSKKHIQELFSKGSSFYLYPFKVIILPIIAHKGGLHQVLVSVSKRNFKRAVDRNLIKRRMREAYRVEKHLLTSNVPLQIAFLYVAKEILAYEPIHKGILASIKKLASQPAYKIADAPNENITSF
jgi:ribonuclease P protein component